MKRAIEFLKKNISPDEIPVAAIVVKDGDIISSACNRKEFEKDVTSHAEIIALRSAAQKLGRWRLDDCEMYVTLEPCPMCAWAILQSRIDNLYFGAYDNVYGAFSVLPELWTIANSKINVKGGIMESKCKKLLDEYFEKMR